jgi:hypothetical protein
MGGLGSWSGYRARADHYPLEEVAAGERVLDEDTYDVAPTLAGLRRHEEQEGRKP